MGIRILRRDRDFSDDRVKWAGPLGPHGVGVPVILLCRMKNTEEVPDECRGPDGLPGGQQEGHMAPGNSHLPAHLRPWGSEPWRSQAQVLHEIHSPSLLAWTHGPSPHTFPGNGRCSLDSGLNTSSPQQHPHRFHRAVVSITAKVLAWEAGDLWAPQEALCLRSPLTWTRPRAQGWSRELLWIYLSASPSSIKDSL